MIRKTIGFRGTNLFSDKPIWDNCGHQLQQEWLKRLDMFRSWAQNVADWGKDGEIGAGGQGVPWNFEPCPMKLPSGKLT